MNILSTGLLMFVLCFSLANATGGTRTIKISQVRLHVDPANSTFGQIWFSDANNNGYLYFQQAEINLGDAGAKAFLAMLMFAKANSQCVDVSYNDSNYPQYIYEISYKDQCP